MARTDTPHTPAILANTGPADPATAPLTPVFATPTPALTPDARTAEQVQFARKIARDDAARDAAPKVTLIALADFTLVSDIDEESIVVAGDEFEISEYDLARYSNRGRLKTLDVPTKAGITSNRV